MARTDAWSSGAGIVGTSVALHLAKRGLSVALVDRAGVGEQTSYGNAGIIEGNTIFRRHFHPISARCYGSPSSARARPTINCPSCPGFYPGYWHSAPLRNPNVWPKRRG